MAMSENAKITLSSNELELVCNTNWILTKHTIIQKVYSLFGQAIVPLQQMLQDGNHNFEAAIFIQPPKISKGENYRQLPYVMFDYPRCFDKDSSFAIRTFFWWGNFFSVTLQLSGKYKQAFLQQLKNSFPYLQENDFYICINEDQWQHHFEEDNYVPLTGLTQRDFSAILSRESFVKIAKKIPLQEWESANDFIVAAYSSLLNVLQKD